MQEERFTSAADRNERWQQLRERGTRHVVRYSTQVWLDEFEIRSYNAKHHLMGRMEFIVSWPVN